MDGGLRCTLSPVDEEADGDGVLLVTRVSEGQSISKLFSERALIKRIVADLETLPEECGVVRLCVARARVRVCVRAAGNLATTPVNPAEQVNAVLNLTPT